MESTCRVILVDGKQYRVGFDNGRVYDVVALYRRTNSRYEQTLVQRTLWSANTWKPMVQTKLVRRVIEAAIKAF